MYMNVVDCSIMICMYIANVDSPSCPVESAAPFVKETLFNELSAKEYDNMIIIIFSYF